MCGIKIICSIICLCFLTVCTYMDIQMRKLPAGLLTLGSLLSVVCALAEKRELWYLHLAGAGVGLVFFLVGKATREAIGYGDCWLICNLGMFLGIRNLLVVLVVCWTILSVTAMGCLVKKKWSRKASLPLVPFLTAGYIFLIVERFIKCS